MCNQHLPKHISRRDILRYSLAGAGIAALGPLNGVMPVATGAPLAGHKRVVVVFCNGGYDGLNMLVPVTSSAYYDRRPGIAVPDASALDIGETDYKLHPAFVRMAGLWSDGDGAAIRKVGYPDENLSHFISTDIHSWGVRGAFDELGIARSGWMARYADLYAPTAMGAVAIGVGRHPVLSGGNSNPFMADELATFRFENEAVSEDVHAHRLAAIQDILSSYSSTGATAQTSQAIGQAHQVAQQIQDAVNNYTSSFADDYPDSPPGQYLKEFARLIQGGFETQVMYTAFSGWDTHVQQGAEAGLQATLISTLDAALGAFTDDLKEMGAYDDTLILVVTEFGRRIFENNSGGTDHGHGNTFFAFGGGVLGGLYGPDLDESELESENWLDYEVDYRDVLRAAIANHIGHDAGPVLPEAQELTVSLNYV